jgi:hypothetical protein
MNLGEPDALRFGARKRNITWRQCFNQRVGTTELP